MSRGLSSHVSQDTFFPDTCKMSGVIVKEEKPQKITAMITFLIMKSRDPGPTSRKRQQKIISEDPLKK